jgi:ADP-ribose pyrophosphatase YjhB (NUDIX family)
VPPVRLRPSARAVILDEEDRILLCRFEFARDGQQVVVWATPGGGVEQGESLLAALRRELREEVGLELGADAPPHVWHQEAVRPGQVAGYDGAVNDFFLVRVPAFTPRGSLSDAELAAENVTGMRWWTRAQIAGYQGTDLFGPRNLAKLLAALLHNGPPAEPLTLEA